MTDPGPYRNVTFLRAAADDLRSLADRRPALALEVFALLKRLDDGRLVPHRLRHFGKTGDLGDCGKVRVVVDGHPEHRIVVRGTEGAFVVVDVVAVEERADDLAYLLAALRLGRLVDPVRRSDTQRRVARILAARGRGLSGPRSDGD